MKMIGALRAVIRRLANLTDAYGEAPRVLELPDGQVYVLLGRDDPVALDLAGPNLHLESEAGRAYRSQCALELLDTDVYGFMALILKGGERPELVFRAQTEPEWCHTFAAGLARVAAELSR